MMINMSSPKSELPPSSEVILQKILAEVTEIKTCMNGRLIDLELKVAVLVRTCNKIAAQLSKKNEEQKESEKKTSIGVETTEPIALDIEEENEKQFSDMPWSKESDYPNGCWLGNPKNAMRRVRSPILPLNLSKINSLCKTPQKMALFLLDHLFTKEDLSISNISGKSRTGKKKLNLLFMFAIKCHLEYIFSITNKEWHKICQNIDSKCRFAARQLQHNARISLNTKKKMVSLKESKNSNTGEDSEEINFYYESIGHAGIEIGTFKDISETPCELRIINATPSQIDQLQQSHEIILEEILPSASDNKTLLIKDEPIRLEANIRATSVTDTLDEHMKDTEMSISDDKVA